MTTIQGLNENEIESGYFGEVPAGNPLVALGVLDEAKPEPTGLSKVIARQKAESEDTGVLTKIGESFTGGFERIKEAGEGLATGKFNVPEAFARGGAGALQSLFSPISGVLQEGVEESIQAMSDDFKKNVMDKTAPTIQSVVQWYEGQSPDQQRHLDNIGVGLEVLLEMVGGAAVKKPLQEIAGEAIEATKETAQAGVGLAKQGVEQLTEKVSDIQFPGKKSELDELPTEMRTEKGLINGVEVEVPVVDRGVAEKITKTFTKDVTNKTLAGKAVSPRTVGKNAKQKLNSIANVEKNTKKFYENVRTGVLEGDISTLENAAQTIVNNIDTVGERIGSAVKQVDGTITFDNKITDEIIEALNTRGAEVSPASPLLRKFFDSLGNGQLNIADAYELKKAYSNEVTKLYKSGDAGTAQYKALSDGVKFLNEQIDNIIDTKLGGEFAKDKELFTSLKLLVDDMVASSLVEGRRSANTLAERIGLVESLFSPVSSAKQKLIQSVDDLNTRGGAWKELIKRYDEEAIKGFKGGTPKSSIIDSKEIDVNNQKQVNNIFESYKKKNQDNTGIVIDSDEIKKLFSDFDPKAPELVHRPSSDLSQIFYEKSLKENPAKKVVLTAGGGGSGKSEVLIKDIKSGEPSIVFDGTGKDFDKMVKNYDKAIAAGKDAQIDAVYIDFRKAKAFNEARERTVPIKLLEGTHSGYRKTLLRMLKERPDININLKHNFGIKDKNGKAVARIIPKNEIIDFLERRQELER